MQTPEPAGLELERPRRLDELLNAVGTLWLRHVATFLATALIVVGAVDLAIFGLGQGLLFSGYDESPDQIWGATGAVALALVSTPLVTAVHVTVVQDIAAGRQPSTARALSAGLDVFPLVLLVVLLSALGVALGLIALVIPGIFLAIRWFVAAQAAVIERPGGARAALGRSSALVKGSWWRVLGIAVLLIVVAGVASAFIALPFEAAADALDLGVISLVGIILGEALPLSFTALAGTLLYFDLRARRRRHETDA